MNSRAPSKTLRIIGGKYRGRKVTFPEINGVRPTPNRIRETLFNWLTPYLPGARCLEPFAGSGILSMEALSRGAESVMIIDQSPQVIEHIRGQIANFTLAASDYTLHLGDALAWVKTQTISAPYNIVFLDPPFSQQLAVSYCHQLSEFHLLAQETLIYIESDEPISEQSLPENWAVKRQKKAASVHYCLCCIQ